MGFLDSLKKVFSSDKETPAQPQAAQPKPSRDSFYLDTLLGAAPVRA